MLPAIKVAAVSNLTDARYFAAREMDWLGFCFKSGDANYIDPLAAAAIAEWVEGPGLLGEFGLAAPEDIWAVAERVGLAGIQLDRFHDEALPPSFGQRQCFREWIVDEASDAASLRAFCQRHSADTDYFVLDFAKNGYTWAALQSGQAPLSVAEVAGLCAAFPLFLGLDCAPGELPDLLGQLGPQGLQVRGGQEEKVGYKSFDALDAWFDALDDLRGA